MKKILFPIITAASLIFEPACTMVSAEKKMTIGRLEKILIPRLNMTYTGKVDTGAKTSTLHAIFLREVSVKNEPYVVFYTVNREGRKVKVRSKIVNRKRIRSSNGCVSKRIIIREKVILGTYSKTIDISLKDRSTLKYKFLIGRDFIRDKFVVDVSKKFLFGE